MSRISFTPATPLYVNISGTLNQIPEFTGSPTQPFADSLLASSGSTLASFATNQVFSNAQILTLPNNANAFNVSSGLFNIDTLNRRVGIDTLIPLSKFHVASGDIRFDSGYGLIGFTNTSGFVLRSNGTRFIPTQLSYSDLGGTPSIPTVTGSLNYISKFNGSNSITNSALIESGTILYYGSNLGSRTFSNTKFVITTVLNGAEETKNIGIFAEAQGSSTGDSAGIYGHGWTYPGLVAGGLSAGITGEGKVTNSTDVSSAIGVRGYSNDTHSGGFNIALFGNASGSGTGNYALYMSAGNIYSNVAQTWRLSSSTTALNIASNLMIFDTTNNRIGVGVSPTSAFHVLGTSTTFASTTASSAGIFRVEGTATNKLFIGSFSDNPFGMYLQTNSATYPLLLQPIGGNVGIGTNVATTFATTGALVLGRNISSQQWALKIFGGNDANCAPIISLFRSGNTESIIGGIKDGSLACLALGIGGGIANFNDTSVASYSQVKISSLNMDISLSGYGLKLPASPGNSDSQVIDAYNENTRSVTTGTSGWTYVTCTQYWTLVGRKVTLHTIFTGGTSSATSPASVPTPPGLTPIRIAAGSAINSSGTALGNAVCVATTSGTILTSNTISSSIIDKVLSVTYEIV